jgi:hypothetical protein
VKHCHAPGLPCSDRIIGLQGGSACLWINGCERSGKNYEPILRIIPRDTSWVTWGELVEPRMLAEFRDRDKVSNTRLCAAVYSGSVPAHPIPAADCSQQVCRLHGSGSDIADRGCHDDTRK